MVRSLRDTATAALAEEIASLFSLAGCQVTIGDAYPGWTPNPRSALLGLCSEVYRRDFQSEAVTQVIHAGLECGLIVGTHPGLDIVSFGPTIKGAHAPGERVDIASVERTWHLLRAILCAL
jgi:dipeptidase D